LAWITSCAAMHERYLNQLQKNSDLPNEGQRSRRRQRNVKLRAAQL
jgi:hypothetical protein